MSVGQGCLGVIQGKWEGGRCIRMSFLIQHWHNKGQEQVGSKVLLGFILTLIDQVGLSATWGLNGVFWGTCVYYSKGVFQDVHVYYSTTKRLSWKDIISKIDHYWCTRKFFCSITKYRCNPDMLVHACNPSTQAKAKQQSCAETQFSAAETRPRVNPQCTERGAGTPQRQPFEDTG